VPLSSDTLNNGDIVGTPAYMAPEQINGQTPVGPAVDIYALGVVLYEALTQSRPFEGSLGSLLAQITTDAPEPPSVRRAEIDAQLSAICLKALQKKPENRFRSMAEFATALQGWSDGQAQRPARNHSRDKKIAITVALTVTVLVVALFVWRPWQA